MFTFDFHIDYISEYGGTIHEGKQALSRRDIRLESISNNNSLFLLLYLLVVEPITFLTYYFITNSIIIPTTASRRKLTRKLII